MKQNTCKNHCSGKLPGIGRINTFLIYRRKLVWVLPARASSTSMAGQRRPARARFTMHPALSNYSVSLVSLCEKKDFYSTFLPLLPPSLSLSLPIALTLSLCEGERGRLHRAWQHCFVECELELWNKDTRHPWKQRARPGEGACLFSADVQAAASLRWDLPHLHFEVLPLERLIVRVYWLWLWKYSVSPDFT